MVHIDISPSSLARRTGDEKFPFEDKFFALEHEYPTRDTPAYLTQPYIQDVPGGMCQTPGECSLR